MQEFKTNVDNRPAEDTDSDNSPTGQLPEWHPFAVWKSQIRSEQMAATGEYRTLSSGKIADA